MDFEAIKVQSAPAVKPSAPQVTESVRSSTPVKSLEEGVKIQTNKEPEKTSSNNMKVAAKEEDKTREYTENEVKSMIKAVNEKLSLVGKHFEYKVHEVTKQLMIKVVDSTTKEVIKEIPPEKGQDSLAKLWELAGILVDEKR